MALLIVAKIQLVYDVDYLPQQDAILHVVVGVGKGGLHDGLLDRGGGIHRQSLQSGEERVVDKIQQPVGGHGRAGFIIMGPALPAAFGGDDGRIAFIVPLPVLLFGVIYF